MSWLERLAEQISTAKGASLTTDQLYSDFENYRDNCRDPNLRLSYPPDMRHFRKAERPQAATVDIILSFMDRKYRGLDLPILNELVATLEKEAPLNRGGEVNRILRKEKWRRGHSYWLPANMRLLDKYNGHYALLRIDSKRILRAELVGITFRSTNILMASLYWMCRDILRVGDLLVNSYRFTGTTVCQSTDAVIEPAPISFLRAARGIETANNSNRLHVMGGLVVGEKDDDPTTLFHARVALVKLKINESASENHLHFRQVAERADLQKCLENISLQPAVNAHLYWNFLIKNDHAIGALDARNLLLELPLESVIV